MKVCIIGSGLVSLTLAKVLALKGLSVDILIKNDIRKLGQSRTISITKSNVDYFNEHILNIQNLLWEIKQIKIFTEKFDKGEILNFANFNNKAFSVVRNDEIYSILKKNLAFYKNIKFKKEKNYNQLIKENYNLIINCEYNSKITRKFFSKHVKKKYYSFAYTTIITHQSKIKNNIATQIFTKNGPIAFLPISNKKTSVVYSFKDKMNSNTDKIIKLIHRFNPGFKIKNIENPLKFELNSSNLRNYYKDNILAFGELLHKIHPLAGQGFNMSLRDIKLLSLLIDKRLDIGLEIDSSLCYEFEKEIKDKNFIFSAGIDFIYEFFNLESKIQNKAISKSISTLGKNKFINNFFKKIADEGFLRS